MLPEIVGFYADESLDFHMVQGRYFTVSRVFIEKRTDVSGDFRRFELIHQCKNS
jgi:hypothetical protein